jgi:hypothetical protein
MNNANIISDVLKKLQLWSIPYTASILNAASISLIYSLGRIVFFSAASNEFTWLVDSIG